MDAPEQICIRAARTADAAALARLSEQLGYRRRRCDAAQRLAGLRRDPGAAIFVACKAQAIVGWLEVHVVTTLESGDRAEIMGLVVERQHRRSGVGQKLVTSACQWAIEQGQQTLRVRTNVTRPQAPQFYESLQFHEVKLQKVFELALVS